MVGFTLESGWINVGKWLDLRWKMVGLTGTQAIRVKKVNFTCKCTNTIF